MMKRSIQLTISIFFAIFGFTGAWSDDPPDMEVNPLTGNIESVDSTTETAYKIRYIEDPGPGHQIDISTISGADSAHPRIAIDGQGTSWVVWWDSAAGEVRIKSRDPQTGLWSTDELISDPAETSERPEIVIDGSTAWVGYEIRFARSFSIATVGIIDGPEPVSARTVVATTDFTGDLDTLIHTEDGKVWTTWVDSQSEVGWSQYDAASGVWSAAVYESYAGSDVVTARQAIALIVLGP